MVDGVKMEEKMRLELKEFVRHEVEEHKVCVVLVLVFYFVFVVFALCVLVQWQCQCGLFVCMSV